MCKLFYFILIVCFIYPVFSSENKDCWYNKKIENNKIFLYEKGSGNTKEDAINDALNKFYETFIEQNDLYEINFDYIFYNKEYIRNLYSELENNINLYSVENIDYYDNTYYVLLSLKRKEIIDYYTKELDYINGKINSLYDTLKNSNILASYSLKNVLLVYSNNAKKLTIILYNL